MSNCSIDLTKLKTYSIKERKSKVSVNDVGRAHKGGATFEDFVHSLPKFLAAKDLRELAEGIVKARAKGRPVILSMGAHPIKVGLSPIIIDLIERDIITAVATNGASIIHDFEMAYLGQTSEDVAAELDSGAFGMARETAQWVNRAIIEGVNKGHGIGRAIGESIASSSFPHKDLSIFAACYKKGIAATVHVAIGTDIIHMHPEADGAAIGEGSLRDFRLFTEVVSGLEGGVYINVGSAVIMPEIFLKALTTVRNLGFQVFDFTTANMDFIQHYRPTVNILRRPTHKGGRHIALTGHHEIMFPLLAAIVVEAL
jgi:hypothetical protein